MGGGDKNLIELAGKPVLRHVLDRVDFANRPIMLNANGDPVAASDCQRLKSECDSAIDDPYPTGSFTSKGTTNVMGDVEEFVFAGTDLDGQDYLDLSRLAYTSIVRPSVFRKLDKPVRLPAAVIEEAFIKANPALDPDMITVTCKKECIQEVRICLSKTLEPVPCGQDVIRDCSLTRAILPPIR